MIPEGLIDAVRIALESEPGVWTPRSLAADLDVTVAQLGAAVKAAGLAPEWAPPGGGVPHHSTVKAAALRREFAAFLGRGLSNTEIADALGVRRETVARYAREARLTGKSAAVAAILRRGSATAAEVAATVGCCERLVYLAATKARLRHRIRRAA